MVATTGRTAEPSRDAPASREAPSARPDPATHPAAGVLAAGNHAVQRLATEERQAEQVARRVALSAPPADGDAASHALPTAAGSGAPPRGVRVRTDARAGRIAEALHARAVTHGREILFAPGAYAPGTAAGRGLLAHELTHVAQQRTGPPRLRRSPEEDVLRSSVTPAWAEQLSDEELGSVIRLLRTHLSEVGVDAPDAMALSSNLSTLEHEQARRGGPASVGPAAPLADRLAAFKRRVLAVAVQRLLANRQNLGLWAAMVEHDFDAQQLRYVALAQSGSIGVYEQLQQERNPRVRELRANQAFGRYRACTGCHVEVQARAWEHEQPMADFWRTPAEQRAGLPSPHAPEPLFAPSGVGPPATSMPSQERMASLIEWMKADMASGTSPSAQPGADAPTQEPGPPPAFPATTGRPAARPGTYAPPAGTAEARLHAMFPDPAEARAAVERLRPVLQQLGPEGYKVLPGDMLARLEREPVTTVRADILARIHERRDDYRELAQKVEAGDLDYGHFLPIIQDLLPTADAEVQAAIREEMEDEAFWRKVEAVVVGIVSIAVLLLTIFPPTTALGVAGLATLEIGLGVHGVVRGSQSIATGRAYQLGQGANDVFTPEQQAAADAMVLGGFVEVVAGGLSWLGGWSRMGSLPRAAPAAGTALARQGQAAGGPAAALPPGVSPGRTIQRGPYLLTLEADGSAIVTISGRPDLIMVVRGGTATLYQRLGGGGGVRVVGTAPLPAHGPMALPGGGSSTALTVPGPGGAATGPLVGPSGTPLLPGPAQTPLLPGPAQTPLLPGPAPTPLLPGPRPVPLLSAGPATTRTLQQVRNLRGAERWQEAEVWAQEMYGSTGQQHFPVPARGGPEPITGTGGRFVDVPVPQSGGRTFAGEVKMYGRWRTVEGVPQQRTVPLSEHIRQQILKDAWLRDNVPGYDPRWLFLDAPPSPELAGLLREKNIAFVIYE